VQCKLQEKAKGDGGDQPFLIASFEKKGTEVINLF
jgi:hypothetical protein